MKTVGVSATTILTLAFLMIVTVQGCHKIQSSKKTNAARNEDNSGQPISFDNSSQPIACTLSASKLGERKSGIGRELQSALIAVKELENGFAYSFPSDDETQARLTQFIALEQECCAFLRFRLQPERENQRIWLEVTGPEGTKEFLKDMFHPQG